MFWVYVGLLALSAVCRTGLALSAGKTISLVERGELSSSAILTPAALALVAPVVTLLAELQAGHLMRNVSGGLRNETYSMLVRKPYSFFLQADRAELHSRLMYDVMEVIGAYLQSVNAVVIATTAGTFAVVTTASFHPLLALPLVVAVVLSLVAARVWAPRVRSRYREVSEASSSLTAAILYGTSRTALLDAIIYQQRNLLSKSFERSVSSHAKAQRKRLNTNSLGSFTLDALNGMALAATLVAGFILMQREDSGIGIGEVSAASLLVMAALTPMTSISEQIMASTGARENLARIRELQQGGPAKSTTVLGRSVDHPENVLGGGVSPVVLEMRDAGYDYLADDSGMPAGLRAPSGITASVDSRSSMSRVSGITLSLRAGGLLGLTGPSGVGKSTAALLAVGALEATTGRVYRRTGGRVVLVTSEMSDHSGTFLEYLDPHGLASERDLLAAVDAVELVQLIEERGGLAAPFAPETGSFSTGQLRRVMIAKAISVKPDAIILDETLTHIDLQQSLRILSKLRMRGHGVLLITHNQNHLNLCDHVVTLGE